MVAHCTSTPIFLSQLASRVKISYNSTITDLWSAYIIPTRPLWNIIEFDSTWLTDPLPPTHFSGHFHSFRRLVPFQQLTNWCNYCITLCFIDTVYQQQNKQKYPVSILPGQRDGQHFWDLLQWYDHKFLITIVYNENSPLEVCRIRYCRIDRSFNPYAIFRVISIHFVLLPFIESICFYERLYRSLLAYFIYRWNAFFIKHCPSWSKSLKIYFLLVTYLSHFAEHKPNFYVMITLLLSLHQLMKISFMFYDEV